MTDFTDVGISHELKLQHADVQEIGNDDIIKGIWWFEDGKWEPQGIDRGPVYAMLRKGTDQSPGGYLDLFEIISTGTNAPLLVIDQGLIVKKDISAGGFVCSNQGELYLGSGRNDQVDVPKIILTYSDVSRLQGGGSLDVPEIPSGDQFPAGEKGQLFIYTPTSSLYKHNGSIWLYLGPTSNYAGYFDTLYLRKANAQDPANLDLGTLIVHDNIYSDIDKKLGFVGDSNGTPGTNLGYIDFKDTHSAGDRTLDFKGTYHTDGKYQWHWDFWDGSDWYLKAALTEDGQLKLPVNGSGGGLKIGDDVHLYRSAENVLYTPDSVAIGAAASVSSARDAIVNSVKGTSSSGALKGGDEFTVAWDESYLYVTSHNKHMNLATASGKDVVVQRNMHVLGNLTVDGTMPSWNGGTVTNNITITNSLPAIIFNSSTEHLGDIAFRKDGVTKFNVGIWQNDYFYIWDSPNNRDLFRVTPNGQVQIPVNSTAAGLKIGSDITIYRQTSPSVALEIDANTIIDHNLNIGEGCSVTGVLGVGGLLSITRTGAWTQLYLNPAQPDARIEKSNYSGSANYFWLDANADSGQTAMIGLFRGTCAGTPKFVILAGDNYATTPFEFRPRSNELVIGGDVSIYRSTTTTLKIGGHLIVGAENLNINPSGANAQLALQQNGTTKAYFIWNGTHTWLTGTGNLYISAGSDIVLGPSGSYIWVSGSKNFCPSSVNSGNIGTNTQYWGSMWANYLKYHSSCSSFDALDDLALVKNYKTTKETREVSDQNVEVEVIAKESLPFLLDEEGFYEAGAMSGFLLGCVKALVLRLEALETELKQRGENA
jgi:hypothetical protein